MKEELSSYVGENLLFNRGVIGITFST